MQPLKSNNFYEMNKTVFPRTGARGLPQQFPRRLYDMLESESQGTGDKLIQWTASGLAFEIVDVTLFSALVLPKYYKTNRFSSFQRNLNLVSTFHVLKHILCQSLSIIECNALDIYCRPT